MNCCECNTPISETEPYFWGRHGGEWHPRCYAVWESKGHLTTGMWRNYNGPMDSPFEYNRATEELRPVRKGFLGSWNFPSDEPELTLGDMRGSGI